MNIRRILLLVWVSASAVWLSYLLWRMWSLYRLFSWAELHCVQCTFVPQTRAEFVRSTVYDATWLLGPPLVALVVGVGTVWAVGKFHNRTPRRTN